MNETIVQPDSNAQNKRFPLKRIVLGVGGTLVAGALGCDTNTGAVSIEPIPDSNGSNQPIIDNSGLTVAQQATELTLTPSRTFEPPVVITVTANPEAAGGDDPEMTPPPDETPLPAELEEIAEQLREISFIEFDDNERGTDPDLMEGDCNRLRTRLAREQYIREISYVAGLLVAQGCAEPTGATTRSDFMKARIIIDGLTDADGVFDCDRARTYRGLAETYIAEGEPELADNFLDAAGDLIGQEGLGVFGAPDSNRQIAYRIAEALKAGLLANGCPAE
ncbi:MAG TPA: hypothetical protein VGA67_01040 [Candidatus Dojkabacteria bacterium]|jgi:hypothetical protein